MYLYQSHVMAVEDILVQVFEAFDSRTHFDINVAVVCLGEGEDCKEQSNCCRLWSFPTFKVRSFFGRRYSGYPSLLAIISSQNLFGKADRHFPSSWRHGEFLFSCPQGPCTIKFLTASYSLWLVSGFGMLQFTTLSIVSASTLAWFSLIISSIWQQGNPCFWNSMVCEFE